jgi:hypothetical protein
VADNSSKPQSQQPEVDFSTEKPVFQWTTAEFAQYTKTSVWYIVVVLIAITLCVLFWWMKNWTAIGVIVAATIALIAQARAKPRNVAVSIYRAGVVLNDKVYPYSALKSFWIIPGEHPVFRLDRTGFLAAHINVPIADEDPAQIQLFLAKFLPEDQDRGEDIADVIQRWTRF